MARLKTALSVRAGPLEPRPTPETENREVPTEPPPLSVEEERLALQDLFLELETARFSEGRDVEWADSVESEVLDALVVEGSSVERFECGRSLCELHARHEDRGVAEAFRLAMVAPLSGSLGSVRWRVEADRTIAFFIRKGSPWPADALSPRRGRP